MVILKKRVGGAAWWSVARHGRPNQGEWGEAKEKGQLMKDRLSGHKDYENHENGLVC